MEKKIRKVRLFPFMTVARLSYDGTDSRELIVSRLANGTYDLYITNALHCDITYLCRGAQIVTINRYAKQYGIEFVR